MAWLKDFLFDQLSSIPLPREAVLVNARLGLCYRFFQLCAFGMAVWVVSYNTVKEYTPTTIDIEFWRQGAEVAKASALGNISHCSDLAEYEYNYSSTLHYKPTRCRTLSEGEDLIKSAQSMYFMTLVQDRTSHSASGLDCPGVEAACRASNGGFTPETPDEDCRCTYQDEYYIKQQERNQFMLRHSYMVQDTWAGDSFERASSGHPYFFTGAEGKWQQAQGKMLTKIKKEDGTPCTVGGKSEYLPEDGDIGGPIEDWLACGGLSLDSRSDETRGYNADISSIGPQLRTSGAKVSLQLKYLNRNPSIRDGIHAVCEISVRVLPAWNSRATTDYATFPDKFTGSTEQRYRYRYSYGITFEFDKTGSFSFFNPNSLLTAIVNIIVIFGVPLQIIWYIAVYGVGTVSTVYGSVLRQRFSIFHQFHGLSTRMMVSSMAFRALTKQWDTRIEDLKPMSFEQVSRLMMEVHNRDITQENSKMNAMELQKLANVVIAHLDLDANKSITYDEFVHSCASLEHVNAQTMLKFFDEDRRRWPIEWLLDPTRNQIDDLHKSLASLKETFIANMNTNSSSSQRPEIANEPEILRMEM